MTPTPEAAALATLQDRFAICDALARYCESIDAGDIDAIAAVFTMDCATDYGPSGGGIVRGRAQLLDRLRASQSRFRRTHHQLGQIRFEVEGSGGSSVAYVTASHLWHDASRHEVRMQYHDTWVRTPEGLRICGRRTLSTVVDGLPGVERHWLKRKELRSDHGCID